MATIKIKWSVQELANVLTLFDVCKVYRSTAGVSGPYVEITGPGTRVALVLGQSAYEFDDTAGSTSYWYKISYFHETTLLESELSDPIQGTGGGNYLTIQDMRDAGFTTTDADDDRVADVIEQVEEFIEQVTGRWFYPRNLVIRVDGNGSPILPLVAPIIQIDSITYLASYGSPADILSEVDLDSVRVYNRHLTSAWSTTDDDRQAPRLEFNLGAGRWYEGRQNIEIDGWFGYTVLGRGDPVGETVAGSQKPQSMGQTPPMIRRVAMLLAARYLPTPADPDAYEDAIKRWAIERHETRDQRIEYSDNTFAMGPITGDAEIDRVLSAYSRPPAIAIL